MQKASDLSFRMVIGRLQAEQIHANAAREPMREMHWTEQSRLAHNLAGGDGPVGAEMSVEVLLWALAGVCLVGVPLVTALRVPALVVVTAVLAVHVWAVGILAGLPEPIAAEVLIEGVLALAGCCLAARLLSAVAGAAAGLASPAIDSGREWVPRAARRDEHPEIGTPRPTETRAVG
jgi:hypothetical protein